MTLDRDTVPKIFGRKEGPLKTQILTVQCEDRDVLCCLLMAREFQDAETTPADVDPDPGGGLDSLKGAAPLRPSKPPRRKV
jgi:hypothetical protein